ncbi:MAG: hypothetical protein LJE68_03285 [Rhodobacter sp.]|nr:hypothetical protein [Rhodobacter sp.]
MDIDLLTAALGWISVINIAFLTIATLAIVVMRRMAIWAHQGLFGLSEQALDEIYFRWLAQYKLLVLVFNIAPYLAFRLFL